MKTSHITALAALLLALTATLQASAQGTTSPYSKFGYGLLTDGATGAQRSMGGVGYAMHNGRMVNTMNPAAYAATDSLTFLWDIGLDLTNLWSKEGDKSGHDLGGGLDYLAMQFPITKNMGMSAGLVPISSVGYTYGSAIDGGIDSRSGEGGINKLYLGYAIRPIGGLSLGVNASYNFGTIVNDVYAYSSTATALYEQILQVRDWGLQFGAQYTHKFSRKHSATLGLVYTLGKTLRGKTWGTAKNSADNFVNSTDTISLKDRYTQPSTYGAGLSYCYDSRLDVEVDFTYQPWAKARFEALPKFNADGTNIALNNRWRVGLGTSFTPNPRGSYFKRVAYRLGAYYNHDYMRVRDNNVTDYGISAGLGLPVPGGKTLVNLGFEYKKRKASPASLVNETYFNITLGVTFNELWFWQNKIH